jgi:hypothetical protein
MNRLLFGDNLKWLRDTRVFPDASVDRVYMKAQKPRRRCLHIREKKSGGAQNRVKTLPVPQKSRRWPLKNDLQIYETGRK